MSRSNREVCFTRVSSIGYAQDSLDPFLPLAYSPPTDRQLDLGKQFDVDLTGKNSVSARPVLHKAMKAAAEKIIAANSLLPGMECLLDETVPCVITKVGDAAWGFTARGSIVLIRTKEGNRNGFWVHPIRLSQLKTHG